MRGRSVVDQRTHNPQAAGSTPAPATILFRPLVWLGDWIKRRVTRRPPDFIIGGHENPYLLRWWAIPRNRFFNIYLHEFRRSDDDRALHDHPWFNLSVLLEGRYVEHTIKAGGVRVAVERWRGAVKFRAPWSAHRVELHEEERCWTLFITGPVLRAWGFHCPNGWRHWKEFTDARDSGQIGRGCE